MQDHQEELRSEQRYVAGLYDRLDAERDRVKERHDAALAARDGTPIERDVQVRELAGRVKRLRVADDGLCFGRLDPAPPGGPRYVGRIGILDPEREYEPMLLDWRAPAARPFYTATGANPEGMRRRRRLHTRGRRVVDFTDEPLGRPEPGSGGSGLGDHRDEAALLAAVNAPRGEGMRDIVATIQAEQDEIIRSEHPGVLVIEGGPGTGKTVVALHRVAYLLYTQRDRMERHGVLVVGPNPAFLHHIGQVLPSLGESDVVFATTGDLLPGLRTTVEDTPEASRRKGSLEVLDVLAAAVADRQRLPEQPLPVELGGVRLTVDAETAEWARDEARASGRPHNEARAVFVEIVTYVLTERAIGRIGRGWLAPADRVDRERLRADLHEQLGQDDAFAAVIDQLWPVLTPERVLAGLYTAPDADPVLRRADGAAWTVSDVPLLDELAELLGRDPAAERVARRAATREEAAEAEYAQAVLGGLRLDHEELDEDLGFQATDLMVAGGLADRFAERDTRELAERAAADRDWTYRHVVVDEAQELSAMDWRVLMRRCPSRSFTVVGDLAQRRSPAGAGADGPGWGQMLEPYVPGRWEYRTLTVNYRTPAEIMEVAGALLADFAPGARPPESVRACGVRPWARRVGGGRAGGGGADSAAEDAELAAAVAEFVRDETGRPGTHVVIGPPGTPGAVPAAQTKGLEFDAVLVVEPERILADVPRGAAELYVALTRATQRLGVLHREPLPAALAGLAPIVSSCECAAPGTR